MVKDGRRVPAELRCIGNCRILSWATHSVVDTNELVVFRREVDGNLTEGLAAGAPFAELPRAA